MTNRRVYTGIDAFRIVAALLVVAIHISPLSVYNETADFILTRVIGRTAVPFFFMTTGFFLLERHGIHLEKLLHFLKKTALITVISILIYIPLNIYNGYFSQEQLVKTIVLDLFLNGTFYHLWYLPASMLGLTLAWLALKYLGYYRAFLLFLGVYVIGLLGDSYYGLSQLIPGVGTLMNGYLDFFVTTRNGLFFAPLYFLLGGVLGTYRLRLKPSVCAVALFVSFLGMLAEALLLRSLGWMHHDSMYFFLIPTMFFLFHLLTLWQGHRLSGVSSAMLTVYLIHPWIIVLVRLMAKLIGQEGLLVENHLIHYVIVSLGSFGIAYVFEAVKKWPSLKKVGKVKK